MLVPCTAKPGPGGLMAATPVVSVDEPCFELSETNVQAPGSRGWRRYQCFYVIRNDKRRLFMRDLGPATQFTTGQFRIPGGVEDPVTGRGEILHTVGELMDIADLLRSPYFEQPEPPVASDLVGGYHDIPDHQRRTRKKLSVFGPRVRVQRG